ncbi:MAG: helix-turn-helix domain-containing protein [Bacteroidales bacterium]|nr:helix-turn-helix domain-containing protein [Bacteroidales bacterium]
MTTQVMYLVSKDDIKDIAISIVEQLRKEIPEPVESKEEKLYTSEEACAYLRCSKPTLHRWKKEGIIPHVRIGSNIRYKESDLRNLLESKKK